MYILFWVRIFVISNFLVIYSYFRAKLIVTVSEYSTSSSDRFTAAFGETWLSFSAISLRPFSFQRGHKGPTGNVQFCTHTTLDLVYAHHRCVLRLWPKSFLFVSRLDVVIPHFHHSSSLLSQNIILQWLALVSNEEIRRIRKIWRKWDYIGDLLRERKWEYPEHSSKRACVKVSLRLIVTIAFYY